MIECNIYLNIPNRNYPDILIAKYSFDPGLKIGDKVNINDFEWNQITAPQKLLKIQEKLNQSFETIVKVREYLIKYKNLDNNLFEINIQLEIANKEINFKLARILEYDYKILQKSEN